MGGVAARSLCDLTTPVVEVLLNALATSLLKMAGSTSAQSISNTRGIGTIVLTQQVFLSSLSKHQTCSFHYIAKLAAAPLG